MSSQSYQTEVAEVQSWFESQEHLIMKMEKTGKYTTAEITHHLEELKMERNDVLQLARVKYGVKGNSGVVVLFAGRELLGWKVVA